MLSHGVGIGQRKRCDSEQRPFLRCQHGTMLDGLLMQKAGNCLQGDATVRVELDKACLDATD